MAIIKLNQIEFVDVYESRGGIVVVITYKEGHQKTLYGSRAREFLAEYYKGEEHAQYE